MNLFNFILTRQLVLNKTEDAARANKLGLLTSMIPGTLGMMMGVMLAEREEAPPARPSNGGGSKDPPPTGRSLSAGKAGVSPS